MDNVVRDTLISKSTLLSWIGEAQGGLRYNGNGSDDYWYSVHDLNAIANEADCCIDQCSDLESLYRWLYCTLRRVVKWLDDERYHTANDIWLKRLDKAWQAMAPIVVKELKGENMRGVLSELGFSQKQQTRKD